MKIIVDKMPQKPEECLFSKFNCEYGFLCTLDHKDIGHCECINCAYLRPLHPTVKESRKESITNIMKELGIPAAIKGYEYIRYAIEIVIADPSMIDSITKVLYPTIAEKFSVTKAAVERGIRNAIETGWMRANEDMIMNLFGYSVSIDKGKPTNSEFIATVADYIIMAETQLRE